MKPKKFFFILCGILAAMIVLGGAGYYFASTNLNDGTKQLSQRLAERKLLDDKLQALEDLEKQNKRIEPTLRLIDKALPAEKQQTAISVQLRNMAASSGMQLNSISFPASAAPGPTSQTVAAGDILAIPVTFQLRGSYNQLQAFLAQQERLERYTSINSLAINESGGGFSFDITLNAYMKP